MRFVATLLIRIYQWTVSPLLGPTCRFHPSCSNYALEAINRFGMLRGGWLTVKRLGTMPSVASGWFRSGAADLIRESAPRPSAITRHMTNNPRIYLWIALALMVWLNYDAWQRDYGPRPDVITNTTRSANGIPATAATRATWRIRFRRLPKEARYGQAPKAPTDSSLPGTSETATTEATAASGGARPHRCTRSRHRHARRYDSARGPDQLSEGQRRGGARSPGKPGRSADPVSAAVGPDRAAINTQPPDAAHQREDGLPTRQRRRVARAADLDEPGGCRGYEDICLSPRRISRGHRLRCSRTTRSRRGQPPRTRRYCATTRAPSGRCSTSRLTLITGRPSSTARNITSSIQPTTTTAVCPSMSLMAGLRRYNITLLLRSFRRRISSITSR